MIEVNSRSLVELSRGLHFWYAFVCPCDKLAMCETRGFGRVRMGFSKPESFGNHHPNPPISFFLFFADFSSRAPPIYLFHCRFKSLDKVKKVSERRETEGNCWQLGKNKAHLSFPRELAISETRREWSDRKGAKAKFKKSRSHQCGEAF